MAMTMGGNASAARHRLRSRRQRRRGRNRWLVWLVAPVVLDYGATALIARIKGVTGVHSSFVLRRVRDTAALPVTAGRTINGGGA